MSLFAELWQASPPVGGSRRGFPRDARVVERDVAAVAPLPPIRPLVLAALLSFASAVHAQVVIAPLSPPDGAASPASEDVITLRDGTILRGHVTELRPGDHVEIVLLDGRPRTISWNDIGASSGPSFPVHESDRVARWLHPSPGRVPVLLDAPRPIAVGVLRLRPAIGQSSMTFDDDEGDVSQLNVNYQSRSGVVVCPATPCRIYARPGPLRLQASGEDVLSYSADLDVPPSGVRVALRTPNVARRRWGTLLALQGAAALVAGAVMVGIGAAQPAPPAPVFPGEMPLPDHRGTYYGIGGAIIGLGALMLVPGVVLWATNRRGIASVTPLSDGIRF